MHRLNLGMFRVGGPDMQLLVPCKSVLAGKWPVALFANERLRTRVATFVSPEMFGLGEGFLTNSTDQGLHP